MYQPPPEFYPSVTTLSLPASLPSSCRHGNTAAPAGRPGRTRPAGYARGFEVGGKIGAARQRNIDVDCPMLWFERPAGVSCPTRQYRAQGGIWQAGVKR